MFSYTAYGLVVQSSVPLPEFVPFQGQADVIVRVDRSGVPFEIPPAHAWYLSVTRREAVLALGRVGTFLARDGRDVTIIPEPGVDDSLLRLYLVGTVMAMVLYQRGVLVLHGSAVAMNGEAVAFLGASGAGKSTLAAALVASGHPMIADDVVAVTFTPRGPVVSPGFPQLKLSLESAGSLGYREETLLELPAVEDKRGCRVAHIPPTPLPLKSVYVLDQGDTLQTEPIKMHDAVIELVRNSYPTRLSQDGDAQHLLHCARLATVLPLRRLIRPFSLAVLPDVVRLLSETVSYEGRMVRA